MATLEDEDLSTFQMNRASYVLEVEPWMLRRDKGIKRGRGILGPGGGRSAGLSLSVVVGPMRVGRRQIGGAIG